MLCASLRATVSLAVAGHSVWSVNHQYGPLPTTYTWGYYRSDVSCVFGKFLDQAYIARLHAGTRIASTASSCRTVSAYADFKLHSAAAWLVLLNCFHALIDDPHDPPIARTTEMMLDAGTGLTNVVLWDLAFLALARPTFLNNTTASIMTELSAHLARYSDPNGPSQLGPRCEHAVPEPAITWYADRLGQRVTILYTAQPFTEAYALRPYALQRMLRGFQLLSPRGSDVLHIQKNLTGLPAPYRQAAIALGNWVLSKEVMGREHLHETAREKDGRYTTFRLTSTTSGPLLPIRLSRGAGVSYTARAEVSRCGPFGPR